ncbi:MAG: hypothetical protein FWG50_10310 [Kiritimatiellaeota bacterium]|nr:hypothetical protein [Kiritimatiellota bacterium]
MSDEQSKLLLLAVGGGGGRLAATVRALYQGEMRVLCMDTDALANREVQRDADIPCVLFGARRLAGNGTGGNPALGLEAFNDDAALLEGHLANVRTAVILTCLGGGTGTGATPEIANMLNGKGIATLCIATHPFTFEGPERWNAASRMHMQLEDSVDALMDVNLDDLFDEAGAQTAAQANDAANALLASGVTLLWRLVTRPGFVCADPERLNGLIARGGNVRFASAVATGHDRVAQLMESLRNNRLLRGRETLGKANAILVGILGGDDLRLAEIGDTMKALRAYCNADCHVEMGTVLDPAFDGRIELVVFAFENWKIPGALEPPVADPLLIPNKPGKRAKKPASKLSHGATGRGKFHNVEPTIWEDDDLDVPTYHRRGIRLER